MPNPLLPLERAVRPDPWSVLLEYATGLKGWASFGAKLVGVDLGRRVGQRFSSAQIGPIGEAQLLEFILTHPWDAARLIASSATRVAHERTLGATPVYDPQGITVSEETPVVNALTVGGYGLTAAGAYRVIRALNRDAMSVGNFDFTGIEAAFPPRPVARPTQLGPRGFNAGTGPSRVAYLEEAASLIRQAREGGLPSQAAFDRLRQIEFRVLGQTTDRLVEEVLQAQFANPLTNPFAAEGAAAAPRFGPTLPEPPRVGIRETLARETQLARSPGVPPRRLTDLVPSEYQFGRPNPLLDAFGHSDLGEGLASAAEDWSIMLGAEEAAVATRPARGLLRAGGGLRNLLGSALRIAGPVGVALEADSFIGGRFERTASEAVIEGLAVASNPLIVARGVARELGQPVPRNLSSAQGVLRNEVARLTPMILRNLTPTQRFAATGNTGLRPEDPEGAALFDRRALYLRLLERIQTEYVPGTTTLPPGLEQYILVDDYRHRLDYARRYYERVQLQATRFPDEAEREDIADARRRYEALRDAPQFFERGVAAAMTVAHLGIRAVNAAMAALEQNAAPQLPEPSALPEPEPLTPDQSFRLRYGLFPYPD